MKSDRVARSHRPNHAYVGTPTCGTAWPTPPRPKNVFTARSCSGVEGRGRFASVRITLRSNTLTPMSGARWDAHPCDDARLYYSLSALQAARRFGTLYLSTQ